MVNALALIIVAQFFLYGMLPFRPVAAIFYIGVTLGLAYRYGEQPGKPGGVVPDMVAALEFSLWPLIVLLGAFRTMFSRKRVGPPPTGAVAAARQPRRR